MKRSTPFVYSAVVLTVLLVAGFSVSPAAEHPGSSVEHPGKSTADKGKGITSDTVKKAVTDYVDAQTKSSEGILSVYDEKLSKDWRLKLVKIHDPVRQYEESGKTIFFACTDFKAVDSNDLLDIDLWMAPSDGTLKVIDTKIHKVNGEERYKYEGAKLKPIK